MLVAQPGPTLSNPIDCSLPGFSVHEILQARILEWIAIPFRGSSRLRNRTQVSALQADSLPSEPPGKPKDSQLRCQIQNPVKQVSVAPTQPLPKAPGCSMEVPSLRRIKAEIYWHLCKACSPPSTTRKGLQDTLHKGGHGDPGVCTSRRSPEGWGPEGEPGPQAQPRPSPCSRPTAAPQARLAGQLACPCTPNAPAI